MVAFYSTIALAILIVIDGLVVGDQKIPQPFHYDGVPPLTLAASAGDLATMKLLIDAGVDLNQLDWLGQTALHMASKFQQVEAAKLLLQRGANCCIPNDEYRETPLHLAAKTGCLDIMDSLITHGANVNAKIPEDFTPGGTPLSYAALYNPYSYLTAKALIDKGANPNGVNSQGETVLQLYADAGNIRAVELLISNNGNVDILNGGNCTTLYHLAANEDDSHNWAVFSYLLSKGARTDITCSSKTKATPLHNAVARGNLAYIDLLLKRFADVNARDRLGRTPLYQAVNNAGDVNEQVVTILLQNGADPNASPYSPTDCKNSTVLGSLLRRIRFEGDESQSKSRVLKLLLASGASVDQSCYVSTDMLSSLKVSNEAPADTRGMGAVKALTTRNALLTASVFGDYDTIGSLVSGGDGRRVWVNYTDSSSGKTALHYVVSGEYVYPAKMLLDAGSDVNAMDSAGRQPLHLAARSGNIRMMQLLIERGAKVNSNSGGATPLRLAIEYANSAASTEFLLKKGAVIEKSDPSLLHLAAHNQNTRIIQLLVDNGVDVNVRSPSNYNRTAFSLLIDSDCCYPQIPVLGVLLDKGANIESRDVNGMTPLMIASAARKRKEVIKFLVDHGANPNAVNNYGCKAPLFLTINLAHVDVGRYYRHTMVPTDDDSEVLTVCRYLVGSGAQPKSPDACYGRTPTEVAREKGLTNVTAYFQTF